MTRKYYAKTINKLSKMTDTQLWQHYRNIRTQFSLLEEQSITLGELENRGYRGLIIDGVLVR
jgi:hypothetical protein